MLFILTQCKVCQENIFGYDVSTSEFTVSAVERLESNIFLQLTSNESMVNDDDDDDDVIEQHLIGEMSTILERDEHS